MFPLIPVPRHEVGERGVFSEKLGPGLFLGPFVDLGLSQVRVSFVPSNGAKHVVKLSCMQLAEAQRCRYGRHVLQEAIMRKDETAGPVRGNEGEGVSAQIVSQDVFGLTDKLN